LAPFIAFDLEPHHTFSIIDDNMNQSTRTDNITIVMDENLVINTIGNAIGRYGTPEIFN